MSTPHASDYDQLKALFLQLHEVSAADRDAQLAQLEADCPVLAARLRQLLGAAQQPLDSLDRSAAPDEPAEFPRYRLVRELGRGGMGRVWLAERSDGAFSQRYALKQLDRDQWSAAERERFVRERQILAELDHPHIAALVDGGNDSRGAPFLVTTFVDGLRIDDYCQRGNLPLRDRVRLLRDLADAVASAHRKLIVHRDIKPANVLVDQAGVAKLLDFGIAKLLGDRSNTTAAGASLMTLRYAAPEQVRGERVGVGCDIYALGVLLYELVAGQSPYGATDNAAALTHAILHHQPAPPSQEARRHQRAGVDADIDAICARALRKRAEDRYASADALCADLDRYLAYEPVQARRGEYGYQLRRWLRRHWASLLVLATLLGMGLYHVHRLDQQLTATQQERDRARAVGRLFVDMYRKLPPAEVRGGDVTARRLLELTSRDLLQARRTDHDDKLDGLLLDAVADAHKALGLTAQAEPLYAEAARRLRQAGADWSQDTADVEARWAGALYDLRQFEQALTVLEQGRQRLRERHLGDSVAYLDQTNTSGLVLQALKRRDQARQRYTEVLDAAAVQRGDASSVRIAALTNLATLELGDGNGARAEQLLREADAAVATQPSEAPDQGLKIRFNLAWVLRDRGNVVESRRLFEDVLARGRQHWGSPHGHLSIVLSQFATLDLLTGHAADALAKLEEASAGEIALVGADHDRVRALRYLRVLALVEHEDNTLAAAELADLTQAQAPSGLTLLAAAVLQCRRQATPAALAAVEQHAQVTAGHGIHRWALPLAQRWSNACRTAVQATGATAAPSP